jgi:hypothetical protein
MLGSNRHGQYRSIKSACAKSKACLQRLSRPTLKRFDGKKFWEAQVIEFFGRSFIAIFGALPKFTWI